jgi:hypothetical protein
MTYKSPTIFYSVISIIFVCNTWIFGSWAIIVSFTVIIVVMIMIIIILLFFTFGAYLLSYHTTVIIGRIFKKIELSESIRYASGDPIESWLHALLCLDVTNSIPNISRLENYL